MKVQKQIDQLLAQRAAEWLEALKSAERDNHAAFLHWLRQSKLHVEHYLDLECLDVQIRMLDKTRGPDVDALLEQIAPDVRQLEPPARQQGGQPRLQRYRVWAIAASVCTIIILATLGAAYRIFPPFAQQVATAIGEQRTLTLPDGSLISMNVDTAVRIDYAPKARNVELISGEAIFKVAHDASRPFIVHTPAVDIRAVGTQFNVYQRQRQTTLVSVIEGRVQVTTAPAFTVRSVGASIATQNLDAGEEARVTRHRIEKRAHPDVSKTVSWRQRRLYFDDMPLDEMAREFNRYGGPLTLKVEGIAPGSYRFGGTFNADDPASFADILEQQKDLAVERRSDAIVIRRRR